MKILGIKREIKNKWEARVPINPQSVKCLVDEGYKVIVQPSDIRVYPDVDYKQAGAQISMDLSNANLILGVKEIKATELIAGVPHLFFSHTIKGQDYNMPLLKKILNDEITLFDYEKIVDEHDKRLVFFGRFAGNGGMVETLYAMGQRYFQEFGITTPLSQVKRAYEYTDIPDAVKQLKVIGEQIKNQGIPHELAPLVIFLTGYGNVAKGCLDILTALPIEHIQPADLASIADNPRRDCIYLVQFKENQMSKRTDGTAFDLHDYFTNGQAYESKMTDYFQYCSAYVNAIYWTEDYPVFLGDAELAKMPKTAVVGDITCDINGSVTATTMSTPIDEPVFIYNPQTQTQVNGFVGKGIADMAIDNLPCEFAKEASDSFSRTLMPFIRDMLNNDYTKPISESTLPAAMSKSVIAHHGKLEKDFEYLYEYLK